ncbi:hypothetical protein PHLCEN_2v102 [Hermanssonia centrifuga]|uniref:Uncharacterized protein n=1 Tax=Hermanssonia centrifuga TaxID=98765 RepID=A0A2R6S6V9_9APHY|nr:hypothetical protein PHLCEN_2v102 [Hermanssonia centrifuga]
MSFKLSFAAFAALAAATVVHGAEVQYYTTRSCSGAASQDYRNVACNSCIDPPGGMPIPTSQFTPPDRHYHTPDWWAVQFSGLGVNNRVTVHNQVGQAYGNVCFAAGATALRSAWVACPGNIVERNATTIDTEAHVVAE